MTFRNDQSPRAWLALGIVSAACVLWWAFARAELVAAFVFRVRPGQPIYDVDFVFRRVMAVWVAGMVAATLILMAAYRLRRRAVVGTSVAARVFFVATLGLAAFVWATVRELIHKPLVSSAIGVALLAYLTGAAFDYWRENGRTVPK